MQLYRLAKEKYIRDLSGTGARLYGGRWNEKGISMLYTSEHCSLALLELLVHTPHNLIPDDTCLLKLNLPDDMSIATLEETHLPENWQHYPAPDALGEIGSRWIQGAESVGLKVPSALVPDEWNVLLNPEYQSFDRVDIASITSFQIDVRL